MNELAGIIARIEELGDIPRPQAYRIPSLWIHPRHKDGDRVLNVDPVDFIRSSIEEILNSPDETPAILSSSGEWSSQAVVYNMFARQTDAWDHDGDGRILLDDLQGGFRETGTFLKAIALLPYIRRLGVNTIHLLPVTAIGRDGNKGTLGSPYAIRNPYKLDERLAEPWLGVDVEKQFAAFVEAAHRLGLRVVSEFVFRTTSKDSDWIPEHPGWFYWIDASVPDRDPAKGTDGYGNPRFNEEELRIINLRVRRNDSSSLPPPGVTYRQLFSEAPESAELVDGRYIGVTDGGRALRIPGAFADWPPDDVQPPWNDVTYLKLYDHPQFNYIAYNTIRVYDSRLTQVENENRGLWNTVINIIPYHQKNFNIDGVMIDMGHALPRRLKQSIVDRARKLNPDFAFWEENFAISVKSRQEGYNAAVGYLWADEHIPDKLREFCSMLAAQDTPVPFFATAENHNTPRAASRPAGMLFSRMAFCINAFLPGILFIHQGFELGETWPVNTGLGFTPEQIAALPSQRLPLFSESALCWDNREEMTDLVARVSEIRSEWELLVIDPRCRTFRHIEATNRRILCFARVSSDGASTIVIAANMDFNEHVTARMQFPLDLFEITDALSGAVVSSHEYGYDIRFAPGQVYIFPLTEPPV